MDKVIFFEFKSRGEGFSRSDLACCDAETRVEGSCCCATGIDGWIYIIPRSSGFKVRAQILFVIANLRSIVSNDGHP